MEQVDWSKAPADATHYYADKQRWFRVIDNLAWFWLGYRWEPSNDFNIDRRVKTRDMIPRTATWNGDGLPPVGTVCEAYVCGTWRRVEVFAHKSEGETMDALFSYTDDVDATRWGWLDDATRFRPIRTPEQIAAEERERYITRMWSTIVTERDDDVAV